MGRDVTTVSSACVCTESLHILQPLPGGGAERRRAWQAHARVHLEQGMISPNPSLVM